MAKKINAKSKADTPIKKKKRKIREEVEEDDVLGFDTASVYGDMLDDINFKLADADVIDDVQPMSTGSLNLDVILGGGIRPSMYTLAGGEQSSKTTHALVVMAAAIQSKVPIVALRDFEGSTGASIPYVTSILQTMGIPVKNSDQIFGKKDPQDARKWLIRPRVRYSASTKGSGFFDWLVKVLIRLPDKKLLNGKWYLVYEDTKENKAQYDQFSVSGMSAKFGRGIYIEAPDGGLQGLVIVDSWPAMSPDVKDEEVGATGLGALARMFSEQLPRVKGYLVSKKVALFGINQLREKPMSMGDPRYEPGGNALKFNSDARIWFTSRALSAVPLWPSGVQKHKRLLNFEVEKSLVGGTDEYRYVHAVAKKNKLSAQGRDGFIRLWTKDGNGVAHGIDPLWDVMFYLHRTGQLNGRGRKKFDLHLYPSQLSRLFDGKKKNDLVEPLVLKNLDWTTMKRWVLGDSSDIKEISKGIGLSKPTDIRDFCFKQVTSGVSEVLISAQDKGKTSKSNDSDDSDDED